MSRKMVIVHWPECTNAPCTCGNDGTMMLSGNVPLKDLDYLVTVFGDCIACDGYILEPSEAPYCPTCARILREGSAL